MSATPREGRETARVRAPKDPRIGKLLDGRFKILSAIGSGGLGTVYRAEQLSVGRAVAIKLLLDDFAVVTDLRRRFEREAKALAALQHPNIVSLTEFGVADGMPYLVMELLEGRTLEQLLHEGPLPPARAVDTIRQILRGLAYAHAKGIAHRDLKPANVFMQALPDGEHVRLLDFGLARFVDAEKDGEATLTQAGMVFGTPAYMAPEQAAGSRADARADVYAAGILFFELLCGRRPFVEPVRADLMRAHLMAKPPDPSSVRPGLLLLADARAVLDKALAKDPKDRYADARDMLAAVEKLPADALRFDASAPATTKGPATAPHGDEPTVAATASSRSAPGARQATTGGVELKRRPRRLAPALFAAVALGVLGAGGWYGFRVVASYFDRRQGQSDFTAQTGPVSPPPTLPPRPRPPLVARPPVAPHPLVRPPAPLVAPPLPAPATPDPWAGRLPRDLAERHAKLLSHGFGPRDVGALQQWVHAHRRDARCHLLFAEALVDIGHNESAALERFRLALELDRRMSGDPRVFGDLAALAAVRAQRDAALGLLVEHYGESATARLDELIAATRDTQARAKLAAVREPLARALATARR